MSNTREATGEMVIKDFIDAAGVHTYYEAEGKGEPLVLLHGGMCPIETYGAIRPALAERYRVYLPERHGQGRTPDIEGAWSHEKFADETVAFLESQGLRSVHLFGWSAGGIVALYVARRRPDLIRSLIIVEAIANHEGDPAQVAELVKLPHMPDGMLPPMLRDLYSAVSPDGPAHFDVVVDKQWQMMKKEPDIDLADLALVNAPALVIVSDHGMVTPTHADAMAKAFPKGRLVTVPDSDHALPLEKADTISSLVLEFLASN